MHGQVLPLGSLRSVGSHAEQLFGPPPEHSRQLMSHSNFYQQVETFILYILYIIYSHIHYLL